MTTIRRFKCDDLFKFNIVNVDPLTETYNISIYMEYYVISSDYFYTAISPSGDIIGYVMAKPSGTPENWHSRISVLAVASEYRRLGIATELMKKVEQISEECKCLFIELFVCVTNLQAVQTFVKFGFVVYRDVLNYFRTGYYEDNAYEMRKSLSRDPEKISMIPYVVEEQAES